MFLTANLEFTYQKQPRRFNFYDIINAKNFIDNFKMSILKWHFKAKLICKLSIAMHNNTFQKMIIFIVALVVRSGLVYM